MRHKAGKLDGQERWGYDAEFPALFLLDAANSSINGADGRTRTDTAFATTPSRWRVYQFHHIGKTFMPSNAPRTSDITSLEPALRYFAG